MRYLFAVYGVGCLVAGCLGATHQFGVAGVCLAVAAGFEMERRRGGDGHDRGDGRKI